jgi:hypothetical protein
VCARLHKRGPAKIVDGGGHIRPRTHKRRITCIMLINASALYLMITIACTIIGPVGIVA